jgi:hypothetical protein
MADYQNYKIEIFPNINDAPVAPTAIAGGNGSHLIAQYNAALEAIKADINLLEQQDPIISILDVTGLKAALDQKVNYADVTFSLIKEKLQTLSETNWLDYSILSNTPDIPAQTSQLINDSGFIKASDAPVRSVAGKTGTVLLTTDDLYEGQYNFFYSENRIDERIYIQQGQANGLATLGSDGKIPSAQLPAIAINETFVVATEAAQLALTAQVGDVAVRTDLKKSFILRVEPGWTLNNWQELLTPTDSVISVNGQTGAVNLVIPTQTNQLTNNSGFITASEAPVQSVAGKAGAVNLTNADISGLGTASTRNVPATGNAVATETVLGSDTRLSDARTPTAHDASLVTSGTFALARIPTIPNTQISGLGTASTRNVPATGNAVATETVLGNDTRLSDARTPTAHSHDLANLGVTWQTFAPALAGTTTAGAFTYSAQSGRYTLIGNFCFFTIVLTVTGTTTAPTGNLRITGLPFTSLNLGNCDFSVSVGFFSGLTSVVPILALLPANSSLINLYKNNNAFLTAADIGASFNLKVSGFYQIN